MGIADRTISGKLTAHSSACMPPMDPPATESSLVMPSESTSFFWSRTMSRMVITGKLSAYGRSVAGLIDPGPLVPWQPPRTLLQMMK